MVILMQLVREGFSYTSGFIYPFSKERGSEKEKCESGQDGKNAKQRKPFYQEVIEVSSLIVVHNMEHPKEIK